MSAIFISYTGRDPEGDAWADRLAAWSVIVQGTPMSRRVSLTRSGAGADRQATAQTARKHNAAFPGPCR